MRNMRSSLLCPDRVAETSAVDDESRWGVNGLHGGLAAYGKPLSDVRSTKDTRDLTGVVRGRC
jgi:hypothetical protein